MVIRLWNFNPTCSAFDLVSFLLQCQRVLDDSAKLNFLVRLFLAEFDVYISFEIKKKITYTVPHIAALVYTGDRYVVSEFHHAV